MFKNPCIRLSLILSVVFISACGYRGALYLPEEPQQTAPKPADQASSETPAEPN
ncbi:lipoprotein [Salinimonas marina]|uniref:Lipoprotein n=1 Tax=Salinimonas marina TaxID=2785918 RepID=A0A7S9DY83_9ALTE|nr:lipoprotein [Salinimonas marina]QPG05808.1 lipoprotein [Salinimonas marina]